jgi:DNA-binding CsgD family transcriptional regulator
LWLVPLGEVLVWMIKVTVMCVFVLAPLIWINLIFIPYARSMLKFIDRTGNMQAIYMKHDISKREAEIIELILEGKGNNEIKDILFISFHTVKNHLSNIYRKLKVKSRHELVHMFMMSGRDNMI